MRKVFQVLAAGVLVAASAAAAGAEERVVPESRAEVMFSYAPVVAEVAPAVVNVYAKRTVLERPSSPFFNDPLFRQFFGGGFLDQPRERMQSSLGSGVMVADGIVVTNNHVIKDADEIKVALADKREFEAEILLKDERTDLAVLKVRGEHKGLPVIEFGNSDDLEVGDLVLAIGNPFGVGQTVTSGIVSALARTQVGISDYQFFIQTDAAINPGNSGGALVDMKGRLIGLNTAIFTRGGGSNGIGFAIPVNMVRIVAESAITGKPVVRPWLGARLQSVTADIAESLGLERPTGALVVRVDPASPGAEAGLKPGDLIVAIDGGAIEDPDSFGYRLATKSVGGRVNLEVIRDQARVVLDLALKPAPEAVPRAEVTIDSRSPFAGMTAVNLSPAVAEEFDITGAEGGVVITGVAPRSPAQQIGLQKGDVLVEINGTEISSTEVLQKAAAERARIWRFAVMRDGRVLRMAVSG